MKTFKRACACTLATAIGLCELDAQVSVPNNNPPPGSYVGHNGSNGSPVEVRHNGNQPIQWFTDSIQRMQLYPINGATLNTFTVPRTGFVGISPIEPFFNNPGPFTRLHLVDSGAAVVNYAQDFGFRPWMRNGVTMTGNSDQMYIGHKYPSLSQVFRAGGHACGRAGHL